MSLLTALSCFGILASIAGGQNKSYLLLTKEVTYSGGKNQELELSCLLETGKITSGIAVLAHAPHKPGL